MVNRFAADLDRLIGPDAHLGIAVSGGPDSCALLLLASASRPGAVEAATVDHALRPEAASEASAVSELCKSLGIAHATLTAKWAEQPTVAIQDRARSERYRLLALWAEQRGLSAIATAHHVDDQAETVVMRLNRGAGVRGLAGMRPVAVAPGSKLPLLRPLLGWRRTELEEICASAGIRPVADPSNADDRFERVRIRAGLRAADWIDAESVARSAAHLAEADEALEWAARIEWDAQVRQLGNEIVYDPRGPAEVRRRVAARAVQTLASEGADGPLRGRDLDRLLVSLARGSSHSLRGVLATGGDAWRFVPAPARARRAG